MEQAETTSWTTRSVGFETLSSKDSQRVWNDTSYGPWFAATHVLKQNASKNDVRIWEQNNASSDFVLGPRMKAVTQKLGHG